MNLSIGIVGLPNVGKSTLFNALVKGNLAEASNYAFTTIDPNVGVVEVPDERLAELAEIEKSGKIVPATVKFVDIAGLIRGAHKGEGLGNQFLSHIREVDAIAMVVRDFRDDKIVHVENKIDPKSDIETVLTELALADLGSIEKKKSEIEKLARSGDKKSKKILEAIEKILQALESGKPASTANLSEEEKDLIREFNLLTIKPIIYVFNVDESNCSENPADLVEEYELADFVGKDQTIVISAKIESELANLSDDERKEFLRDFGLDESGLERLIKLSYKTLGLITFLTAGEMEARAWTAERGAKAPEAAGKIHGDFEKRFIKAEVVGYDDFVKFDGWNSAKEAGKVRIEGKDYVVKDGDVVYFRHG
ncbi:redox-regulated ATPase YchF [Candidatus Berkelbacteria bacterium CG10_big_fil_rev_8_21_14_0_10_41_12]|uniref:Ribosome-binding ATPase YchF n=1 Tax=Candidatus Berkelbacteria bacterium CG10_big_fil_rev_8_21_14_0_10_41_12 TaxID=1974513 RepID=A0A2M6WWG5_9BACT|nr:MAG: redox-regulated ATPase YchF [Candidatus Berkelbacteria bacterium CG10_big_fil_rev_8_21_14_0_10_41_12]